MWPLRRQKPAPSDRQGEIYGLLAFGLAILASFAQLSLSRNLSGEPWQVLAVFGIGIVYTLTACLSGRWTERGDRAATAGYYLFQTLLCVGLIWLSPSRGFFWIVVLPLVAQGIFDLRWPAALALALALFALCVAGIWIPYGRDSGYHAMLAFTPAFTFTTIFALLTKRAFVARQEAERLSRELAEANEQLRAHSAQTEELATNRERNRLAREIHDGLGHYLTVINVQIEAARAVLDREPARAITALEKASRLSREALDEVRASVSNLRQDQTRPLPLPARLAALVQTDGEHVRLRVLGTARVLPSSGEHALYRAAQEGLTNVRKHADARSVEVELDYREAGQVCLTIRDDGRGSATTHSVDTGWGLRGIRERVELLGGKVRAGPHAAGGFELSLQLPG